MYCHYFLLHQPKWCSDSERLGDHFGSCMSESSLCRSLTHELRFWNLRVVDLALLIMQTKRSIMDHKCHVTKMQASVTESTRQREWEQKSSTYWSWIWDEHFPSWAAAGSKPNIMELWTRSRLLEVSCCRTQPWTLTHMVLTWLRLLTFALLYILWFAVSLIAEMQNTTDDGEP